VTDDLPTQLRLWASIAAAGHSVEDAEPIMLHAADRIEQLEGALIAIIITAPFGKPQDIARAALGEKKDGN